MLNTGRRGTRVGRGGTLMCSRCRRMRNPKKYPCMPLDSSDPAGGCMDCHKAGIPCQRRETPSEARERLKRQKWISVESIASWHPQVHHDPDIHDTQANRIAGTQSTGINQNLTLRGSVSSTTYVRKLELYSENRDLPATIHGKVVESLANCEAYQHIDRAILEMETTRFLERLNAYYDNGSLQRLPFVTDADFLTPTRW